jgi:DNA polymerase III epsilon subunit-like protein
MEDNKSWVLIDTETNGISDPIFVVDIAAQRMSGWTPTGAPYQALINQNVDIPPEASRINGYTREILERDGISASAAYQGLRAYAGDLPFVAYNIDFDWDRVLLPEWDRLGIQQIGHKGFCILRLAQRLLDPVPAGNCKLQTLRQFYRLPERGAHSALGDVLTVVDLIEKVLRPISDGRGLDSWIRIQSFTKEEWFPTRISFGKYKGRSFHDARHDRQLREWLEWLSRSKNDRTARMGVWYLSNLEKQQTQRAELNAVAVDLNVSHGPTGAMRSGIVVFHSVEIDEIRFLLTAARERLADLEVIYARECNAIAVSQSKLFSLLKFHYRRRDQLRLKVAYRRRYLDSISSGDDDLDEIRNAFGQEKRKSDKDYEDASKLADSQTSLTEEQQAELKALFRKLVRLFHPDRHANDPDTYKAYTLLTQEITTARDSGDIEKLREIANDPQAYARKIGAGQLDLSDEAELDKLRRLYESIQTKILEMLEALDELHTDPKYELAKLAARRPSYLQDVADEYRQKIEAECVELEREAEDLASQIEELTGSSITDNEP